MPKPQQRDGLCACGQQMDVDWHEYPLYLSEPPYGDPHSRYLCPECDADIYGDMAMAEAERRAEEGEYYA